MLGKIILMLQKQYGMYDHANKVFKGHKRSTESLMVL
jgi:hypothetical protein